MQQHKVLYLSAEEAQADIDRSFYYALMDIEDEKIRQKAAERIYAVSVQGGDAALCVNDRSGGVKPTKNYDDFRKMIEAHRPKVIVLDTWSRFMPLRDENDNAAVTAACGLLEAIIREFDVNIIITHHYNKSAGDYVRNEPGLHTALSQSGIRGGSALVACARWSLAFVPLGHDFAGKLFGKDAGGKPSGTYVACRVVNLAATATQRDGQTYPALTPLFSIMQWESL